MSFRNSCFPILFLFLGFPLLSQSPAAYQKQSYSDEFHYTQRGPFSSPDSNYFNYWYWEIYPNSSRKVKPPFDEWVTFVFNDNKTPGCSNYCAQLTIKKTPPGSQEYQDAEIFNNGSVLGHLPPSVPNQSPCENNPFPYGRLKEVGPPYPMQSSCASSNTMYYNNGSGWNCPMYPSSNISYKVKTRVKAVGRAYGTRGWGFWNTVGQGSDYRFAWFYEYRAPASLVADHNTLFLAITLNGKENRVCVTGLNVDNIYADFHDYEVIWGSKAVDYYIDGNLVASHTNPPMGPGPRLMAYHNWVDNRVTVESVNYHPENTMDKTNIIDYVQALPLPYYNPPNTPFKQICFPISGLTTSETERSGVVANILDILIEEYEEEFLQLQKGQ